MDVDQDNQVPPVLFNYDAAIDGLLRIPPQWRTNIADYISAVEGIIMSRVNGSGDEIDQLLWGIISDLRIPIPRGVFHRAHEAAAFYPDDSDDEDGDVIEFDEEDDGTGWGGRRRRRSVPKKKKSTPKKKKSAPKKKKSAPRKKRSVTKRK